MLKAVLDEAIAGLPQIQQTQTQKTLVASRLLTLASRGERDPIRLREAALGGIDPALSANAL